MTVTDVSAGAVTVDAAAETAVIATLLTNPQCYDDACAIVGANDFSGAAHRAVFEAIDTCERNGEAVDAVTVAAHLRRDGHLERVGGIKTLRELAVHADTANLSTYAAIVAEAALRRRLHSASSAIASYAKDPGRDVDMLTSDSEHAVADAVGDSNENTWKPLASVIADVQTLMETSRSTHLLGQPTGLEQLDDVTAGLQPGALILIAGRPGTGKSVLGLQLAAHVAKVSDAVVPFLSYEMSADELGFRLLASATGLNMSRLQLGNVPAEMTYLVAQEAEKLASTRLLIDDTPPRTIAGVRTALRRLARRTPVSCVVIDYLQLMHGDSRRTDSRAEEISTISRELKLLAKELNVPVIACSQLNRSLESRPNKRPQLSDLRESGSLEQDSNLVMFLYRDSMYNDAAPVDAAELIVAKNRNGPAGVTVPLTWDGPAVRFKPGDNNRGGWAPAPSPGPRGRRTDDIF